MAILLCAGSQNRRGMECRNDGRKALRLLELAMILRDFKAGTQQRLCGDRAQADDQFWSNGF